MIKRICDRCGREIHINENFIHVKFHRFYTDGLIAGVPCLEKDVCEDCYNDMFDKEGKLK